MAFINKLGPPKVKGTRAKERLRDVEKVRHKLFLQQRTASHESPVSDRKNSACCQVPTYWMHLGRCAWRFCVELEEPKWKLPAAQDGSAHGKTHTEGICPPRCPALVFFPVPHPADPLFWHWAAKINTLKATLGIIKND